MAINKPYAYSPSPTKEYASSVTVQLPTTSANQSYLYLSRHNNASNTNSNNNNNNILNYCHHQAATRSLLQASHVSEVTENESEDESPTPPPHYYDIPGIVPAYQGRTSGPPPSYDDVVNPNAPPPSYQSLFGQVREARKTSNGLVDLFRQLFLILIGTLGCTMIIGFLLLIPITMIIVGIFYVNECKAENIPFFLVIGGFIWIVKNILNCYNQFKRDSTTANRPPPRRAPITPTTNRNNSTILTSTTVTTTVVAQHTQIDTDNNNNNIIAIPSSHNSTTTTAATTTTTTQASTVATSESTNTTRTRSREQQTVHRIRQPSLIGITSFKCESMLNYFLVVWFLAGCIIVYRIYEPDYDNPLSTSYCHRTVYLYAFWLMTSAFIIMAIILSCLCCLMASSLLSCNHGR